MPSGLPPEPWVFDFQTDPTPRLGRTVYRPVVTLELAGPRGSTSVFALIDSGSEHTLAAPWVRDAIGAEPEVDREIVLGMGGDTMSVQFAPHVRLRLPPPPNRQDADPIEWNAEVGFPGHWRPPWPAILGQVGFYDEFTVTMQRSVQALAIQRFGAFDDEFGVRYREDQTRAPRFEP